MYIAILAKFKDDSTTGVIKYATVLLENVNFGAGIISNTSYWLQYYIFIVATAS